MRYGLLGAGMMGQEHLRNISLLGKGEVTAICEPDAGMRQAARHVEPEVVFADSIADLLAIEDLDCILIAQVVTALDGIEHMPVPVIRRHIRQGSIHPALCGHCM